MEKPTKIFKSSLQRFDQNIWHFHFVVSKKIGEPFILGNNKRIICTINEMLTFQAALMPLGGGDFFINVNKGIRQKLKINEGDDIQVKLEKDTSEYGLPVPDEFVELLKQDINGNEVFLSLTPGKQRSLIYIIGKPKSADLRIRNGIVILEHLKRNKGNILFKQLTIELKSS